MAGRGDDWAPDSPDPVFNPATGTLEIPSSTTTSFPHSVSGTSQKVIAPGAIMSQVDLERARKAQLEAQGQTIPLDEIPEDLLTPNELERKWEGGVTQTPPQPQQPVSLRPGMAPVAMAPNPNAPPPQPQQEGINQAEFQDRLERYKAARTEQLEAKLRQEAAERDAALERQRQREMAAFQADKAEVARLSRPENLFAQPSTGQKILNAIAAGLGAWGATMGRTPNYALDIIQKRMDDDAKARQLALNTAVKRAQMSGESVDKLIKMQADGDRRNKEARIEQMHWIDANVAKMQARWPAKAQALEQVRADMQAKSAQDTRDFFAQYGGGSTDSTYYGTAVTKTESSGTGAGRNRLPGARDIEAAATAEVMEGKANRLEELTNKGFAPTPEQIADVHNNELQFLARQHKESSSTWENIMGQIGRGANVFPDSIYPKGMRQETREWIRHQRDLWHSEAVALYGLGWLSTPENYAHVAEARAPKIGDTQTDILEKGDVVIKQARIQNRLFREASKPWREMEKRGIPAEVAATVGTGHTPEAGGGLPGGARVPPEGQTPAQVRYTRETKAQQEADKRASGAAPGAGEKPITDRQMGKALKKMPSNIKEGVREAMKVPKGSPKYDMAQKYLREKYEEYAP